jgi:hypothetical protein
MAEYVISLHGCDDVTVFRVELSTEQAALVRRLAEISHKTSMKDCQPTLHIDTFDITDIDKVVSIDEHVYPIPAMGAVARFRLAPDLDRDPSGWDRWLGRGGGVRVEPVGHAVSGVAGEDRPH